MSKTKTIIKIIDNNMLRFTSEKCEGEYLDTRVEITGTFLCGISFPELEDFVNDFSNVISKYRI